ncbi:hypothetical protein Q7P35_000999 [Cladosporium inversicolor]
MNVRRPSGRPSNMGQESSTLAQQSLNISAAGPRATSTHGMQSLNTISNSTNNHHAYSTPRGRSRSPGNGPPSRFPLPQKQRVQSLDTRTRSRSPPPHSTGRLPSPGNVRNKFVREDVGERRHPYDARYKAPQPSPRSPDARLGIRNDGVHQRSPEWRSHSENYQNWARNAGSPNTPREPLAQRPYVSATEIGRNVAAVTIDYHGLRDVPTGPRPKKMDSIARSPPKPEKRDFITRSPCIFISFEYLPKLPDMTRHLRGMLGWKRRPHAIEMDDYGWNLVYEDSPAGLEKLTRCFEKHNNKLLFSEYELCMQCYPNGKQKRSQRDIDTYSSGGPNGSSASQAPHERPGNSVVPRLTGFPGRQLTYFESTQSLESNVDDVPPNAEMADALALVPSHALPDNLFSHPSDMMRTNEVPPMGTSTSLLSIRSDRDETGSLGSGITRSDGSRSKRDRCFRCKGEAVPGSSILVRCSTCPRQYHRRCHQDFVIPTHNTEGSVWSCASCVKKEIAEKQVPQGNIGKPPSKPEEIAPKAASVPEIGPDKAQSEMPDDFCLIAANADGASNAQLQLLRSDSKSPQHETQPQADPDTNAKSGTVDDHATLSDADDLVAKSFAAAGVQSHSKPHSQKTGKLKITRTKLPPKLPSTTAQQSQAEKQPDENGAIPAEQPSATPAGTSVKDANMKQVISRNSVADLRALAHERHQAAIKNGTEGHFTNEEQRIHQNVLENKARLSPAHQPLNEAGVPQQSSTVKRGFVVPAVAKHVTERDEREMPKSPDEIRHSKASKNPIVNPRILALTQPTEIAFVPPPQRSSNVTTAQNEKSPALMRPRAPSAVVRCQNCQKQIPKGPSGKNKLCSGCKRDAAAAATSSNVPTDAKVAPLTSITPLQTSFAPVANMGHSPKTIVAPAELVFRSEEAFEAQQQQQGPSVSIDETGHVTCDNCRQRHTVCTHDDTAAQPPAPAFNQQSGEAGQHTRQTTAGDVDDASLAQEEEAKPTSLDQGRVHNPLAAKILGELQFAPTTQMQLREDPSMAESKIVLLKQILDEIVDAKTDASILAIELAEAQRLSFVKSVVGDSSDRPKGSRLILVAMALGSTASRRMQASDVKGWIASTIPGYNKGEGNWESRISAELSQDKLIPSGSGYWREEEWQDGDGGKPKFKWYQLLPEKENEMWTWCPVLKEPLSPLARREARKRGKDAVQRVTAAARATKSASTAGPATPKFSTDKAVSVYCGSFVLGDDDKLLNAGSTEAAGNDFMELDGLIVEGSTQSVCGLKRKHHSRPDVSDLSTPKKDESSSSEDEPLSAIQKRRRVGTLSQGRANTTAIQQPILANKDVDHQMDLETEMNTNNSANSGDRVDGGLDSASKASDTLANRKKSRMVTLYLNGSPRSSNAETSDRYLLAKHEQLATSLYNEWPEFRQHAADEYDKLAEIQKRPRKKQLFGKLASHPQVRFGNDSPAQIVIPGNFSPEKRSRTRMVDPRPDEPYPWENPDNDPTRKEYTSLEELFDFPDNMIPIISEGQLAYRDGTRTDDGRLPRAREIFKL